MTLTVLFKVDRPDLMPTKAHHTDAGFDIRAVTNYVIPARQRATIGTGVYLDMPATIEAQVRGRSGMAFNKGVLAHVGTIDPGYRGEVKVCLFNMTDSAVLINAGEKIAQLVFSQLMHINLMETKELSASIRGVNGFGSTDNKKD